MGLRLIFIFLALNVLGCAAPSAQEISSFYGDNYKLPSNDRARLLMQELDARQIKYHTETKVYKVKVLYIYEDNTYKQLWPEKRPYKELKEIRNEKREY